MIHISNAFRYVLWLGSEIMLLSNGTLLIWGKVRVTMGTSKSNSALFDF